MRDVLASQSLAMNKLKVERIQVNGRLSKAMPPGLILHDPLGVKGGVGYAYEFAGEAIEALSMEERMTLCNMAIEGGARWVASSRCDHLQVSEGTSIYPFRRRLGSGSAVVEQPGHRP